MNYPKISVALCTYNGEKFVAQQIKSILNQVLLPDELIISDDCSTDSTADIVREFARDNPDLIRFVQGTENVGYIKNFEKAIGLADGEIIFLSDQDDVWFEGKIECMAKPFIDNIHVGLVYCDAILTDLELRPTKYTLFGKRKNLRVNSARLAPLLIKGLGINGCTMAFRSDLKNVALPVGEGWGHDHWLAFIAHSVAEAVPVNQPLMYYRRHENSAGNDPFLEGGRIKVWRTGVNTVSPDQYGKDVCRWEAMLLRLNEIGERQSAAWVDLEKLGVFRCECGRRLELARLRRQIKDMGIFGRVSSICHLLSSGYYHQYLNGLKSFAKDLLIR